MGSWIDTETKTRHSGGKTGTNTGLYDTSEISRLIHRITYLAAIDCLHTTHFYCALSTWN